MYHDPGVPVFGSRIQQVEHIGFALMLAERADVPAARFVRTGVGGADAAAVLVTTPPPGTPIASLPPEQVTDEVLAAAWQRARPAAPRRHRARQPRRAPRARGRRR